MLKRVKIQGYKSLVDVEVKLQPLSVLFGPNAAGKSNFLDALQLLSRIAAGGNLRSVFSPPYRGAPLESFTFGADGIQGLRAKEKVVFSIEVDIEVSREILDDIAHQLQDIAYDVSENPFFREKFLRYRIEIEMLPQSGTLQVENEYLAALDESGELKKQPPLLETQIDTFTLQRRTPNIRVALKRRPAGRSIFTDYYFTEFPYLETLRQELLSWSFFYLEPREHMRISTPIREVHRIGEMGEDISAFLNTLYYADETQFRAVESALHMIVPSITGINVDINNLGEIELTFMEGQTPISPRTVSDGTLRVLGLLALSGVKEKPSLIGFEEPENGIHPRRLQLVASLLKSRAMHNSQVIVTTHSPDLLDFISHENLFMCYKRNGHTIIEPFSNRETPDSNNTLDGEDEELMVSERVLRGDFDA
ncbi:MAG: AAA family ATPase [Ktedonobacteraceae bacterium]|nr:AAA family ATPase [Ktedonobacteraceae bacterium]